MDWLRLLRAPNLLTVPGDPVAGCLLAAGAAAVPDVRLVMVAVAAVLFYAGGLVMNDLVDRAVDQRERPQRPLAAGRIPVSAARVALAVCFVGGAALCAAAGGWVLAAGLLLMSAIAAYNLLHRAGPLAALLMGACRGLNVALGVALAGAAGALAWAGMLLTACFVVALTALARHEMSARKPGWRAWLPASVVLVGFGFVVRQVELTPDMEFRLTGAFFFAFALAGLAAWRLMEGGRGMAPAAIGLLVSALIPLQAALCLASGSGAWGMAAAFLLIVLWPLNRWLARSFAPS
ncbi:MAG TPA: UbiA family prenyltransferase [Kiritimatiellia bacterium]|nr:UbiA family prenyltransferase [Kiritimatiellia bacterium]